MKTVVFDMDGILFDTERLCYDNWMDAAEKYNLKDMDTFFPKCIGLNGNDCKQLFKEYFGESISYDFFQDLTSKMFWEYVEKKGLPVKEGVYKILPYLQQCGYKIGIASSTRYSSIVDHLKRAKIIEYFEVIVAGDMVEHSKPQPDIYLLACKKLGVEPSQAYAIEDSSNGIRAAYLAGMKPIMVPDIVSPSDEIQNLCQHICKDLVEVMKYLNEEWE